MLKVGDRVIITDSMDSDYLGKTAAIVRTFQHNGEPRYYQLDIGGGDWTASCLNLTKEDDNMTKTNAQPKATPIRNNRIKRDFKRLLAIIADAREPDYSEVEQLATKYRLYFDENGVVKEVRG